MTETTAILFNSPALHSLKRDQLVKLCKIHAIKANGKNTDLIHRLKLHALTLPHDDPLSIAARSESTDDDDSSDLPHHHAPPRPSEQWEIVMESIQEVEESASSQGTLTSLRTAQSSGEFGTNASKTSTVSSSIRALATSLGLKRTTTTTTTKPTSTVSSRATQLPDANNDELTQHAVPYSAVTPATPPLNDNFTFDPATASHTRMSVAANGDPLPGCSLRPGIPAPANARLSMGLGLGAPSTPTKKQPTTTIRLVSNSSTNTNTVLSLDAFHTPKLKPLTPSFDLIMSPGGPASSTLGSTRPFWAPDAGPGHVQNIYPTLTNDDLPPTLPPTPIKSPRDKHAVSREGTTSLMVPAAPTNTATTLTPTKPDPFVFGSPLPQHAVSNTQFRTAAASVLEEMNQRLKSEGVDGVGLDIIDHLVPGAHSKQQQQQQQREVKPLPGRLSSTTGRGEVTHKFNGLHQAEFDKMEGIDGMVRRKGVMSESPEKKNNNKSSGLDVPPTVIVGKKRKSSVLGDSEELPRRPMAGPGAARAGRTSGTTRVISSGRRAKALPGAFSDDDDDDEPEERGGKRAKMDPDAVAMHGEDNNNGENTMEVDSGDQEEEKRKAREREREAIKRKLEISRAKRKSSVGVGVAAASAAARRKSGRVSGAAAPKFKPSRFGFLASAKNLVASVWNRGKAAPTSNIPIPAATTAQNPTTKQQKPNVLKKTTPGFAPTKSSSTVSTTSGTSNSRLSSVAQASQQKPSSRSRSPIPPSFGKPGTVASRLSSTNTNTTSSRMSSVGGSSRRRISRASLASNNTRMTGVSSIGTRLSTASSSTGTGTSSSTRSSGIGSLGVVKKKTRSSVSRSSSVTSSRLFTPTASSLAKTKRPPSEAGNGLLKAAVENNAVAHGGSGGQKKKSSLLGAITNSPKVQRSRMVSPSTPLWSPKSPSPATPGKIFSKPVVRSVSRIPVPSPPKKASDGDNKEKDSAEKPTVAPQPTRQRTMTGRKPRISRSKVIARLASQRAAAPGNSAGGSGGARAGSGSGVNKPRSSAGAGLHQKRARSSLGAKPGRASFTGSGSGGGGTSEKERSVLASAKKRVRQSEYARRRSSSRGTGVGVDV